jgi:two-component system, response regulator PdtaR
LKILIVDDEPLIRRSLRRAFEMKKWIVLEADQGEAGLGVWLTEKPDLVLVDMLMPVMTGPEMLEKAPDSLRASTKIVMMSAYTGEFDPEKMKSFGVLQFIAKPFADVFELANQLEAL